MGIGPRTCARCLRARHLYSSTVLGRRPGRSSIQVSAYSAREILFAFAAGVLVIGSGVLPRWLGWVSILAGILFFLQGFGLGGVIASLGLVLDLIAFVLFLIFVLVSSVILLTRQNAVPDTAGAIE